MGIRNFRDRATAEVAAGLDNKRTRRRLPIELQRSALKKMQILRAARTLQDVGNFPGLKLEKLKGQRRDEFSIRINEQFRICFRWKDTDACDVMIEDYH